MRRWNGWGDDSFVHPLPETALPRLIEWVGPAQPPRDARLDQVITAVPKARLPNHLLITTDREERVRHASGDSLPDWVAKRMGRIGAFPDGVAYPETEDDIRALFDYARRAGAKIIPYGGGTSVVGHINPTTGDDPILTVDMSRMNQMSNLDETSRLATFGAGASGPYIEAALRAQGYTLGHFPQSFEYSTLGGWIATRSSGQQSLRYGRIEQHFRGGRLIAPAGVLEMAPYPASAAGPDLRQLVLGSEGRMGIITQATVRVHPLPEYENFHAVFFHHWDEGIEAVRAIVQAKLPLSMLRLSNEAETETTLVLAGHERLVNFAHWGLGTAGYPRFEKCMLLFGATGDAATVRHARRGALHIARQHGGFHTGQYMGEQWRKSRFRTPYLRNTLWETGYAIDTLETIVPWADVPAASQAIIEALQHALDGAEERVHVFAHLSHLYETGASIYVTYVFRALPDPDQMLEVWGRLKRAASQAIVAQGGTISHQHGVGVDHAPYLDAEKGPFGMILIRDVIAACDPDGLLNPGKLLIL